jgi:predicted metal-dependent hydrolase
MPGRLRRVKRPAPPHYETYREFARAVITARVEKLNAAYGFNYGRIAIKNQRRAWGSCSAKGNLNFNYKIVFLPEMLMEYVIVHELCHLAELNHSPAFWQHVERSCPSYRAYRAHLRRITYVPAGGFPSSAAAALR